MNNHNPSNPLIVQGDYTILVEVNSPRYAAARDGLAQFAELVKSPEHVHTYRITPLSIWNACASGVDPQTIVRTLEEFTKYPIPDHVLTGVGDFASRYGRLRIVQESTGLLLVSDEDVLAEEISRAKGVAKYLGERLSPSKFLIDPFNRGRIKQELIKVGYPAEDLAGYVSGEKLGIDLLNTTRSDLPFSPRPYQQAAADAFYAGGTARGGSGVIVLPCGAGKTIVGMTCMAQVQASTLILTTSITAIRQWKAELLDKTGLREDQIAEYSGKTKDIKPVTVATYNIMTYRRSKEASFLHLALFDERDWGLIIYDEVHLLPAPVFQVTASLQARRRLGLTATLVREDGREDDVFALIGPKKADAPWKTLEAQGWIAQATCTEIRIPLPDDLRMPYAVADARRKFRIASENPTKEVVVRQLLERHKDDHVLIIGMYVDQVKGIADRLGIPVITGSTSQLRRDKLYSDFKEGLFPVMAVSKVANFAVDLPDASVAIQISGMFGSRQEEAQRLGRILRPKEGVNQAQFYTLVSKDTSEQDFALKRQLFLCEQGYEYRIQDGMNNAAI
ncbi:DNA repair helicase XPB [Thermodesulfobacteriota bacterium]